MEPGEKVKIVKQGFKVEMNFRRLTNLGMRVYPISGNNPKIKELKK
jgi:hypothetical protein